MTHSGQPDGQRIGHDERQQASDALSEHFSLGRLDLHEFEQRTAMASAARTIEDLRKLFHDLPGPHPTFLSPLSFNAPAPPPSAPPPAWASPPHAPQPWMNPYAQHRSDKSKVAAGILQIFLPFGVGRFYTGHVGIGVAQLLLSFCGIGAVWSFIDGIVILATDSTDSNGRPLNN